MPAWSLAKSPWIEPGARPRVIVTKGDDPYDNTRRALGELGLEPARGRRVLLKPNAGRIFPPGSGVVTEPLVVAAAIDAFREAGAEVMVGDSPIVGVKKLEALEASGIAAVARARRCRLLDLDARPSAAVALPGGRAIAAIKVCAQVLEADLVVSIPVVKCHMHTGVSLAIKNMKGCLWRRSKVDLHMLPALAGCAEKSLDVAIADLSEALLPQLALVDGTVGMEGLGPSAGSPKRLGVVVLSADAYAADAVACTLMGRAARDIAHLRLGAERGYGIIELDELDVTPREWRRFGVSFAAPPENLTIEFPGFAVLDRNSCSACQSTLLLFLKQHAPALFDYFPEQQPIRVAIGKGHADLPEGTLCIGNCTLQHRERGIYVAGCPPVGSAILRTIGRRTGRTTENVPRQGR
jgi:uncharacterized protein (DUF362 family)